MTLKSKSLFAASVVVTIICLCSFQKAGKVSIIGTWVPTSVQTISTKGNPPATDTIVTYTKRGSLVFTADSKYHYASEHGGNTDGTYVIEGNMLKMASPKSQIWGTVVIKLLNEHTLVTSSHGFVIDAPGKVETLTTYTR